MTPKPNPRPHPFRGYTFPFLSYSDKVNAGQPRIDQGKDFTGEGSILAIGRSRILSTHPPPGWPEGGGILYQLLDGPKAGKIVYVYEGVDVKPGIRAGQEVQAGQEIASFRKGGSIEIGWADSSGETIAHDRGEHKPNNSNTRTGIEFARFLGSLNPLRQLKGISPAERAKIAKIAGEEGGKIGVGGIYNVPGLKQAEEVAEGEKGVGDLANEVVSGIVGDLAGSAGPLMLNIGLVGGGAFLVYYGTALMMGVKSPGAKLTAPLKGAMIP